jgi:hypothetical protein
MTIEDDKVIDTKHPTDAGELENATVVRLEDDEDRWALTSARMMKLKKKMNSDAWTDYLEDIMQSWGEKAAGSKDLHLDAASYWKSFGDKIYVPVIILSTIGGVSNFGAATVDNPEHWMYAIGTINMIAAGLASLSQYYKPSEKSQHHYAVARTYGSFYRAVLLELGISREDRMNSDDMIRWAKGEYDRIQAEAPVIPESIIASFRKKHANVRRNIPDIVSNHYEIKINGRTNN